MQGVQEKTRECLMDSLNTWTSSKEDFQMGLLLGMKQNKTSLGVNKTLLGLGKTLN